MEFPLNRVPCTEDVLFDGYGSLTFDNLDLPSTIIAGLNACGFRTLSPVQAQAIPIGIQNRDLLVQAKPGTGKTCVFSVVSLSSVQLQDSWCQVLILNPSREIATQNSMVLAQVGQEMKGLNIATFIGGTPMSASLKGAQNCQIAIGTPGRLAHMVKDGHLKLDKVKVLVLDEADRLMDCSAFSEDLQSVFSAVHPDRQVVAVSATFPEDSTINALELMKNPVKIILDGGDPNLVGLRNVVIDVNKVLEVNDFIPHQEEFVSKYKCLKRLLKHADYTQCLLFCNMILRANKLHEMLVRDGYDAKLLCSNMPQKDRTLAFTNLRNGQGKLFVCSDLCARGLDARGVDMVVNFDLPPDPRIYFHRAGRAGRFGTYGVIINMVTKGQDTSLIKNYESHRVRFYVVDSQYDLKQISNLDTNKNFLSTTNTAESSDTIDFLLTPGEEPDIKSSNGLDESSDKDELSSYCHRVKFQHINEEQIKELVREKVESFNEDIRELITSGLNFGDKCYDEDACIGRKDSSEFTEFNVDDYTNALKGLVLQPLDLNWE